MTTHEFYMKRCIQLAKNGLGTTYPNPLVGSVIVHNDKIIGEGWHKKAGEPHAEVNAVNSVKDKSLLKEATIYVSLEPCSHFGKTPPCCDLIIAHEIPNVVIGTVDPFAKVAGNGIKRLVESGKNVTVGILEDECNEVLRLRTVFETIFDKEITPKFFKLTEGTGIPAHTDLGHKVCINIVLTGSAPVHFRSHGDCYYTCAMLNVAKRHSVPPGSERKMLKFQIADLYFAEASDLWDNYYS